MPLSVISMPVNGCITRSPPPMFVPSGIESAPGTSFEQADAEVLLQERDAAVHPLLEQLRPARSACRVSVVSA